MAQKKIIWSTHARIELENVLNFFYLRNGNINYSLKLLGQVEGLLKTLSKSNLIGRLTSNKTTRVIVMNDYLIFYEINDNQIYIISFWDNRQDINRRKVQ